MIRCIIIEDEPIAAKIIKSFIDEISDLEFIAGFNSSEEAMEWISSNSVDVIFQDVNLPGMNGVDFLKSLAKPPKIIFITANPEYAVDGFELSAVDYLVKPISFKRFEKSIEKLREALKHNPGGEKLIFKANNRTYLIKPEDIIYFESAGDYVKVNTTENNLIVNQTMKELEKTLGSGFVRTHKSYIINKKYVRFIQGNQIDLNDIKIPIGAKYKNSTLDTLS